MVFDELPLKDAYRWLIWGPYRQVLEKGPSTFEIWCNRRLGGLVSETLSGRRVNLENRITEALGPQVNAPRIARECFATHFANQYVGFGFDKVTLQTLPNYVRFEGLEHVERAVEKKRGVVLAHPHMGLPQMALHAMGLRNFDVHQVGGGLTAVSLSEMGVRVAGIRSRLESRICATMHDGNQYLRPLLRALDANGLVFTACDGTGGGIEIGRRMPVEVLGRCYRMPVFPVWLCQQTGASLVPMVCYTDRLQPTRQVVRFEPALQEGDTLEMLSSLGHRFSNWLRESPGDWHFWDQWHSGVGGLLMEGGLNDR